MSYIRTYSNQGYDKASIANALIKLGYPSQNVWDTLNSAAQAKPTPQQPLPTQPVKKAAHAKYAPGALHAAGFHGKLGLEIALVVIPLILIAGGYFIFTQPVCGNGKVERGETIETCCDDAGCLGEQLCENNQCIEPTCGECQRLENHRCISYECCEDADCPPSKMCTANKCEIITCGECQYISNHTCVDHECCDDGDCSADEKCTNHQCISVACGQCQYISNLECMDYACCLDEDCDDNNATTIDICNNPQTLNASCSYVMPDECTTSFACDDNNVSTLDICSGTPKTCSNTPITECTDGDNYCPLNCTYEDDEDCDECAIDYDCDDNDDSTEDTCSGTPKECSNTLITECTTGDNYCPSGCAYQDDEDCDECAIDYDCDDNDISTQDFCSGTPKECSNTLITECITGDSYCPTTCTYINDQDCPCGIDADCDDNDISTQDVCSGTPKACSNILITDCTAGDNYCPLSCDHNNDIDCQVPIECGIDFDCFIVASEDCSRSNVTHTSTLNLSIFGILQTSTSYFELMGIELKKCVFYQRVESINVTFTDEMLQLLLSQNATQEEIDQAIQQANDEADIMEGKDGTCRFDTDDLTAMFNRWKEGTYSSSDYENATCEGDLFTS